MTTPQPCPMQHHEPEPYGPDEEPEVRGLCRYDLAAPEDHHAPHDPDGRAHRAERAMADARARYGAGSPEHRAAVLEFYDATHEPQPDPCAEPRGPLPVDHEPHDPAIAARVAGRMLERREHLPVSPFGR